MIEQYLAIKKQYPDALLFFHLGDFYELFFDDAETASRILEITLTGRDGGQAGRIPMCGVPCHAADSYIARLIEKGYKVAVCDQVEDPKSAKGVVRREVTRVVTPGTVMDGHMLDDKKNNYLAAICTGEQGFGLCTSDITTGEIAIALFTGEKASSSLYDELHRLSPAELLLPESCRESSLVQVAEELGTAVTILPDEEYGAARAWELIEKYFNSTSDKRFPPHDLMMGAVGALLSYLGRTQKRQLQHLRRFNIYAPGEFMVLDTATRRNLELTKSLRDGTRRGTLLEVLDHTVTAMGGRLLRKWIEQPLLDPGQIDRRLDAVEEFCRNTVLREETRRLLDRVYDIERLGAKVAYGSANARDLLSLKASLEVLPGIKTLLGNTPVDLLKELDERIDPLPGIKDLLANAIVDDPPVSVRDGGLIKPGFDAEVDRLRRISRDAKGWLRDLEAEERERTGIKSLKVGYNRVFGYYLEVTKSNLHLVPEDYQRRQTLVNAERFVTPRLKEYEEAIVGAEEKLVNLEYQLFLDVRSKVLAKLPLFQETAAALAVLDALVSLAQAAVKGGYVRPVVHRDDSITITKGRHPVVEQMLGAGEFVPNDTAIGGDEARLAIITGPNMAGKSTYMRQVALIVLMAQMGSFVPADSAEIGVVDRIFTRIGASDDLAGGQSTFMVEMNECRVIVTEATPQSLVIMDEVGRGTSTYDGMSLARALIEYLHDHIGAKTLFSTHYHELTSLDVLPGVKNYTVAVAEEGEEIIFLRRVEPGKSDRSYGIHVARLAGLPEEIIQRAQEVLTELEQNGGRQCASSRDNLKRRFLQLEMFGSSKEQALLQELKDTDLLGITPLEALNKMYEWQQRLRGSKE
ncbi:MAG: DNA mismatch repair protein MutS [Peptococcaceae bacterium]|nr:DNA mismatch repair protein MutS [Peptococcaceae bacterium]